MASKLVIWALFSLLSLASCKLTYTNSTFLTACTDITPCYFLDPLVWQDSSIPETGDTAFVINTPGNTVLYFNSSLDLDQFVLEGNATFRVVENAEFTSNIISMSASTIIIEGNSSVVSNQYTLVHDGSLLVLNSLQGYAQDGTLFSLSDNSSLHIERGYFGLHGRDSFLAGQVTILNSTGFVASASNVVFANNTVIFENEPIIYNATFSNANVTFKQGWRKATYVNLTSSTVTIYNNPQNLQQNFVSVNVDDVSTLYIRGISTCVFNSTNINGTLYISTSTVTISEGTFNAPLVVAGSSVFNAPTMLLGQVSYANGENGEAPIVNFTAEVFHSLRLRAVELPDGILNVTQTAYLRGEFSTEGSVYAYGGVYAEDGTVEVDGDFFLESTPTGAPNQNTLELLNVEFSVDHLSIGANSLFNASGATIDITTTYLHLNSTFHSENSNYVGEVHSEARIQVGSNLTLQGNFKQGSEGILVFRDVNLQTGTNGVLNVQGEADLDGTIAYEIELDILKKGAVEIIAITANKIEGKFKTEPINNGLFSATKSSVHYSPTHVSLVFELTEKPKKSTWWIWFLVVIGLIGASALVGFYFWRKRRNQYTAI